MDGSEATAKTGPFSAKRGFRDREITIAFRVRSSDSFGCVPSLTAEGSARLTTDQARSLAADLLRQADEADARADKKAAAAARRQAWADREVAAGRMKRMTLQEVFGGRR